MPPSHAHFGIDENAGTDPRFVNPLAHSTTNVTSVTVMDIIVVRTGELVANRKREFQAAWSVNAAPPNVTSKKKTIRVSMKLV